MKVSLDNGEFIEVNNLRIIVDNVHFPVLDESAKKENIELHIVYNEEGVVTDVIENDKVYASTWDFYDYIVGETACNDN